MGSFSELFKNSLQNLKAFWEQLNPMRKALLIGGVTALIIGILVFTLTRKQDDYSYLFVDLSETDTQAIGSYLKKNNFTDFVIDARGIKVKDAQIPQLRLQLAAEGLPNEGHIGWEKFDSQDFARTEFDQRVNKLRAIQGELARTISSIEGVQSVRVHIVTPPKSLFIKDRVDPTASIYIRQKRGVELEKKQIRGIQNLVSKAVENLKPKNVTIIDGTGKMLTETETDNEALRKSNEHLSYRREVEKTLEERIRGIVGRIVGPERVVSKVDATVDFTQEVQRITDIDPENFGVVSRNTSSMNMSGTGLNPTGIPGSKSNIPGEQENIGAASSKADNKREQEQINYEIGKKVSEKTLPVGNIKRLSVAVIVDGKQTYPADGSRPDFEPRTEEEMNKIAQLVKSAVGFKEGRDEVTVHNLMFQLDPNQMQVITEKKKEDKEYISTLVVSATVALALVLFFSLVVRPYFRWLSYDPNRKKAEALVEEFKPDLDLGAIQDVQVQEEVPFEKLSPKEQVMYLAKYEPKRTTEALRIMLSPHQTGPA